MDPEQGTQNDAQNAEPQNEDGANAAQVGDETPEGAESLGDAGKQALDRMKGKWQAERDRRKALEGELEKLRAPSAPKQDGEQQPDVDAIRREATQQAVKAANERILKAEIKAAAAGKLADPGDALRLLDVSNFEVDADGNVDADEIAEAIDGLLRSKPYLSAQGVRRFQGSADGGARKGSREGAQLTQDDLKGMKPEAILKAQAEGRLNDLLGIK